MIRADSKKDYDELDKLRHDSVMYSKYKKVMSKIHKHILDNRWYDDDDDFCISYGKYILDLIEDLLKEDK